ncbi:MAG: cytochrome c maturation protein CcmE [Gemmatimonadetes bacterium]|nr:cytochrome c maturation protein CcmE [Gemmatimonadota bacterium]
MKGNGRFLIGLVGVATVVTYLVWTGVTSTMVYYMTPTELVARVAADPTLHDVGIKVSGRVVPDSYEKRPGDNGPIHTFLVEDLEDTSVTFPVEFADNLPDTFTDSEAMIVDVVVEGRFQRDGVFHATTVLTKCGSRYEASAEQLANG